MHHYRKTRKKYSTHNAVDRVLEGCTFCNTFGTPKVLRENKTMFIVANRVSYDIFEGLRVLDHLMVIPKRHLESIDSFTDAEKLDQMNIIAEYECRGYSVYARGVGSVNRSVKHQHTHLMKLGAKKAKLILYSAKPHFLIRK